MLTRFLTVAALALGLAISVSAAEPEPAIKVEAKGTLRTGIIAIGGETTGTIIETSNGTLELDVGNSKELQALVKKLDGKPAVVTGTLTIRKGVEVPLRLIVSVKTLKAAGGKGK